MWSVKDHIHDSLNQCLMPINADQCQLIVLNTALIPIDTNEDQCGIYFSIYSISNQFQNFDGIDQSCRYWSALGIDRGSPAYLTSSFILSHARWMGDFQISPLPLKQWLTGALRFTRACSPLKCLTFLFFSVMDFSYEKLMSPSSLHQFWCILLYFSGLLS